MEDFYVTLSVIKRHFKARFVPEARCFEDVSIDHREEFRRKVRISVGNFQNLFAFGSLVFTRFFPTGFALLSHKILRWFTPFLLILLLITSIGLAPTARLYGIFAGIYMIFLALGLFGILLSGDKKNGWLKYPGHFIYMNMALLKGFFVYLKGVESNVWQPTRRNQQ